MTDILAFAKERIFINAHSSVRLACETGSGERLVVYVDPYLVDAEHGVPEAPHDADVVFFTHSHYDHFSPEDAARVAREDGSTRYVMPASMVDDALTAGIPEDAITAVNPGETFAICGLNARAVRAYNYRKAFHLKDNNWVGYVIEAAPGVRVYVCGDTDANPENAAVTCEIVCIPVGGTYTMNVPEAAALVRTMRSMSADASPALAIPTHYGSVTGTPADGEDFAALLGSDVPVVVPF